PVPRRLRGLTSAASLKHRMQDTLVLGCEGATPRTHVRGLIEARYSRELMVRVRRLRGVTSAASLKHRLCLRRVLGLDRLRGLTSAASLKLRLVRDATRRDAVTPRTHLRGLIKSNRGPARRGGARAAMSARRCGRSAPARCGAPGPGETNDGWSSGTGVR